jgi:hypothetical protein
MAEDVEYWKVKLTASTEHTGICSELQEDFTRDSIETNCQHCIKLNSKLLKAKDEISS